MSGSSRTVQALSAHFYVLLALLVFSPLFRSGKVPLAALLLELLALLAFAVLCWSNARTPRLSPIEKGLLLALVALPLLQLLPLPGLSRLSLPGQADYFTALALVGSDAATTLSILPRETMLGWFILLVPVATFLLTRSMTEPHLRTLLACVFVMAGFQAVLGLLQFGTGESGPFMLGLEGQGGGLAKGTWRGRNNYAGFLYPVLMISMALFLATLGRQKRAAGAQTLREKLVYFSTLQGHKAFLYGALSVLILLAVVFSRSRAGISLTMLGVVLAGVVFSRRIGGENVYGLTGTVVSIGLSLAIAIGLGPVLERFSAADPLSDGRWVIFQGVIEGIRHYFPMGAGTGTFEQTFPVFQDLSQASVTMNQAHNSYLEWLYNGGLLAGVLIVAFLAAYIVRWFQVWRRGLWGDFRYVQVGAGLGLLLTLLHELVDFNLFVPANMVYFAFLAGIFFYPYQEPLPRVKVKSPTAPTEQRSRTVLQPVTTEAGGQPESNPFMD